MSDIPFRIGHGFDVHRFADSEPADVMIRLCGCDIPHTHELLAHSDGDVALHACCDALLGAVGEGDIGRHFPDDDPQYAGADSTELLRKVMAKVEAKGYLLGNIDLTIVTQRPRLAPHMEPMRASLASVIGLDTEAVNIKATTTEKLGYTGRGEGIAVHAVVIVYRKA